MPVIGPGMVLQLQPAAASHEASVAAVVHASGVPPHSPLPSSVHPAWLTHAAEVSRSHIRAVPMHSVPDHAHPL